MSKRSSVRLVGAGVGLAILAGAIVRLLACRGDLWVDEIWSLALLERVHSPIEILTEIKHANNHVLNTLFAYLLGPLDHDELYRAPALLAGVAVIALGAWLGWLGDGAQNASARAPDASPGARAVWAASLFAGSYLLVLYASEARGYSLSLAFLLAAVGIAISADVAPASRCAPSFWAAIALAVLSHPLAVHGFVAVFAWSVLRSLRRPIGWTGRARGLLWWHGPPALGCLAFFAFFLAPARATMSGPRGATLAGWASATAMASGLPSATPHLWPGLLGAGVLAAGLVWLRRRGSDLWLFYAVGIAVSPAALAAVEQSDFAYERFFLVGTTLWLLLAARLLAALGRPGKARRAAALVLLLAFLVGNALLVERLLRDQRGHYRDALRYVLAQSSEPIVTIASDHDFRNRLLIAYHGGRLPSGERLRYVPRGLIGGDAAEWVILHRVDDGDRPARVYRDQAGRRYLLAAHFAATPPSGAHWYLYRRLDRSRDRAASRVPAS